MEPISYFLNPSFQNRIALSDSFTKPDVLKHKSLSGFVPFKKQSPFPLTHRGSRPPPSPNTVNVKQAFRAKP